MPRLPSRCRVRLRQARGGGLPGPTIGGVSLAEGSIITEPTPITATLTPPAGETVAAWSVGVQGEGALRVLATGSGDAVSASLDPTVLPNGAYLLVVTATGSAGGVTVSETPLVVDGRLKLGRYQTRFVDLAVGVGGLPMQVVRRYDSYDKGVGDFGVGWRVEIANFRISTNGPLGEGGWTMASCGGGPIFVFLCFSSDQPHYVTVTWPDGLTEIFDLTPARGSSFLPGLTSAEFTGRPNVTSTLEAVDSSLYFSNGNLLGGFFGSEGIYDPGEFVLTDRFGTEYRLSVGGGLSSVTDRVGNTLTVSSSGIVSTLGPSITFALPTTRTGGWCPPRWGVLPPPPSHTMAGGGSPLRPTRWVG